MIVPDVQVHSDHAVLIHSSAYPARSPQREVTVVDFLAYETFDEGLDQIAGDSVHSLHFASIP